MFNHFMTENLTLVKKDSSKIDGIRASVQNKIYINGTNILVEEDDIFEYINPAGVKNYLKAIKVIYYNHPRLGHVEIDYQKTKILYRVYLDTNIVSRVKDFKLEEEEAKALRVISEKFDKQEIELFISLKVKEEIEKIKEITQREFLLFICNLVKKVPYANLVKSVPSTFGSAPFGVATFGGSYNVESPLLAKLKTLFDKDDAEHIFQAEKANLDYFLTLDRRSIINRINQKPDEFRKIGLRINIVLPTDLINILRDRK